MILKNGDIFKWVLSSDPGNSKKQLDKESIGYICATAETVVGRLTQGTIYPNTLCTVINVQGITITYLNHLGQIRKFCRNNQDCVTGSTNWQARKIK